MENTDRKAKKRAIIEANRQAVKILKNLITNIVKELDLDEEKIDKRINAATSNNEYGAINGLINLVASIANWPVNQGDGSLVATNRKILESEKFNLDLMLLEDIRTYRGYHTFVSDDLEIIEGQEPAYEDYTDYCEILLEDLGATSNRPTICAETWTRIETKRKEESILELEIKQLELQRHKEFLAEQEGVEA